MCVAGAALGRAADALVKADALQAILPLPALLPSSGMRAATVRLASVQDAYAKAKTVLQRSFPRITVVEVLHFLQNGQRGGSSRAGRKPLLEMSPPTGDS